MATYTVEEIHSRLERLERSARRWRFGALGMALLFAGMALMGAAKTREAKLNKLTIVNEYGKTVAELGTDAYGKPRLAYFDPDGKILLDMGTQLGAHLWFRGSDGQSCVQLGVWRWEDQNREIPSLRFCNGKGAESIKLGYDLKYTPALEICCKGGRVVSLSGDE